MTGTAGCWLCWGTAARAGTQKLFEAMLLVCQEIWKVDDEPVILILKFIS